MLGEWSIAKNEPKSKHIRKTHSNSLSYYRSCSYDKRENIFRLWIEKYAPKNISDLCLSPKRVNDIKDWLRRSWNSLHSHEEPLIQGNKHKLLILSGAPGIGKYTSVHLVAQSFGWMILTWNDGNRGEYNGNVGGSSSSSKGETEYISDQSSFQEFLMNASIGYGSFDSYLSGNYNDLQLPSNVHNDGAVIIIDSLPYLHNSKAQNHFRECMTLIIQKTRIPIVIIFSNVYEGRYKPEDIELMIDKSVLYSPSVEIMQCHPVTKSAMKKCLSHIAQNEGLYLSYDINDRFYDEIHLLSGGDLRHAIMNMQFQYSRNKVEELSNKFDLKLKKNTKKHYEQFDIYRDKKLSIFHVLGKLLYAKREKDISSNGYCNSNERNLTNRWSRNTYDKWIGQKRNRMLFDPEKVIEECSMELGCVLSFLEYHCPNFFTDIIELECAINFFSDAAVFLDYSSKVSYKSIIFKFGITLITCYLLFLYTDMKNISISTFPLWYATSFACRAVACAKRQPSSNKFRQFSTPKNFEVMKKKHKNDEQIDQLRKYLCNICSYLMIRSRIGSTGKFIRDIFPFLNKIIPEVDSISKLCSNMMKESRIYEEVLKGTGSVYDTGRQDEILMVDDIVE